MDQQVQEMTKQELIEVIIEQGELARIQRETLETQTRSLDLIIKKAAIAFAIWGILQIALVILLARKR